MSNLSERVKAAREALGWDQAQLGDAVGYTQSSISDIENGTTASPRNWRKLAEALRIPEDEFRRLMVEAARDAGKTTRLPAAVKATMSASIGPVTLDARGSTMHAVPAPVMGARDVPVYGRAQGGPDGRFDFNGQVIGWEFRPPLLEGVPGAYAVYLDGESMWPRYKPGETAWINPNLPAKIGDDVIIQLLPDEEDGVPFGFVKEFVGWRGSKLVATQYNPRMEIEYPRERVKSVHVIVIAQR